MQNKLPSLLLNRLEQIYSKHDLELVFEGFNTPKRPVYFRVNTLKSSIEEVESALDLAGIWYRRDTRLEYGYFLPSGKERDLWDLPIYNEGKIYLQSFSSQLPVQFMELKKGMDVLDLTAAPGGKTSQISERVWETGVVVALENNALRFEKMQHNLKKLGCTNVQAIHGSAEDLWTGVLEVSLKSSEEQIQFDAILFDAPCSGDGNINLYVEKTFSGWEEKYIHYNYKRQKSIIEKNIHLLKSWGILLYSTCTLAPEENEGLVHFLLCNFPELELQDISFEYEFRRPWIKKFGKYIYKSEIEKCLRVLPNAESEWFFIAKLRKR